METRIISIVNQKGGVGKTTTSINLSSFLSRLEKKVLLIDFDPQANATSGVGMDLSSIDKGVYHLLVQDLPLEEVLLPTPFDNLHILPSTKDLSGAEIEMVNIVSRETILKSRISPLMGLYDYIIIDCPPSLGLLTINALTASHKTIIPVQCEYFALEGIAGLVNTLKLVKQSYNDQLDIAGILLTMFDKRTSLNRQVVQNTKEYFEDLVFTTIVPRNIRLTEAPSHGLPIELYDQYSSGAKAYKELAKEVVERV